MPYAILNVADTTGTIRGARCSRLLAIVTRFKLKLALDYPRSHSRIWTSLNPFPSLDLSWSRFNKMKRKLSDPSIEAGSNKNSEIFEMEDSHPVVTLMKTKTPTHLDMAYLEAKRAGNQGEAD